MLHFSEIQQWLILFSGCTVACLAGWAFAVVIPNRNETIRFLNDRIQTLQYWVEGNDLQGIHRTGVGSGFSLELKIRDLEHAKKVVQERLDRIIADLEFFKSANQPNE
jgi:hypothetical protein